MSRRKQVKPKHIHLEADQSEQQPQQQALESADAAAAAPVAGGLGTAIHHLGAGDEMSGDQATVKRPRREDTHICETCCGEFFGSSEFLEHKKGCTNHLPVLIVNDREELVPLEDFPGAVPSHQPRSASGKDSHGENGGSSGGMVEKPGLESVLCLQMEAALPPPPQDLSYLPEGKVTNTNVILQALQGTKVAVNQWRADALPALLPDANSIPWVLEQILCLQQQQLQQIQLTEQIRIQVNTWAAHALHSGMVGADALKTLSTHVSQQVSAAVALLSQKAGSQGLSLEPLKQATLPHTNIPPTASPAAPGLVSFALMPDGSRVLPNHLPGALLPQPPSSVFFQSPFPTVALDPPKKGKGKPPSASSGDVKAKDEATVSKHNCKYCSKVFRSASSLQIHLRSHREERPFMCPVCGHSFTTERNLKVHFNRHPQVKANPWLFAEFHNKIVAGNGVPYAVSVPVPVPLPVPVHESSLSLDSRPVLVPEAPNVGLPQNISSGTNPENVMAGPQATDLPPGPFSESEAGSVLPGVGPNHNPPIVGGSQGRGTPEPGPETLTFPQLVENIDKATTHPNECHICHRVLSCQSSLRMHYRTHSGQRPYRCKVCGRAFSTKGNLKIHLGAHQDNTSVEMQHSCPICQNKFSDAVMLQQHIRVHTGSQVPHVPLLGKPCDFKGPTLMVVGKNGGPSAISHDIKSINVDEAGPQDAPSSSSKVPMPLPSLHLVPPTLGFTMMAPLDALGKGGPAPVALHGPSSHEKGPVENNGLTVDSPSSATGDKKYQSPRPDVLETAPFQALSQVNSQAESIKFKSPEAGSKTENLNSRTEMKGWSSHPLTFVPAQPASVRVEVCGTYRPPPVMPPGMTPFLVAQPGQQGKQQGCKWYSMNHSPASALQAQGPTHTGEKAFVCNICGQAFITRGNLEVHCMTHVANNSFARCGRSLAIKRPMPLLERDGKKLPEILPKKIIVPSVNMNPLVWNQYTTMPSDGLAMKSNKIPVIQSTAMPTLPVSLGASPLASNTAVAKIDPQHSQTPAVSLKGKKDHGPSN